MATKTKSQRTQAVNEAMLLSATDCARMCGISRRSWFRLCSFQKTPPSIKVGGSRRWRKDHVELWIELRCCDRKEFLARLKGGAA